MKVLEEISNVIFVIICVFVIVPVLLVIGILGRILRPDLYSKK